MTFIRSDAGLSNLKIFKRVDYVVFTEGGSGETISLKKALKGVYHKNSDDIQFWKPIFEKFRGGSKYSFRALGSKNTAKQIANLVTAGKVTGVCVCMDRDFDHLYNQQIIHANVLYTRGYSWENELFATPVISRAFHTIDRSGASTSLVKKTLRKVISVFLQELRHFVRADLVLCAAGTPLFRRTSAAASFRRRAAKQSPRIDTRGLRKRLNYLHKNCRGFRLIRTNIRLVPERDCFGKILLHSANHSIDLMLEERGQPKLNHHHTTTFLIRAFHEWIDECPGSPAGRYYKRIVTCI